MLGNIVWYPSFNDNKTFFIFDENGLSYSIRRLSTSARRRDLPDVPLVLLEAVKPFQQKSLRQSVEPLSRKVKDPHRRDHKVGSGVAPARYLYRILEVILHLVQLEVNVVALDVVHGLEDRVWNTKSGPCQKMEFRRYSIKLTSQNFWL